MKFGALRGAVLAAMLCAAGGVLLAQAAPHPDWTGYYIIARGKDLQGFKVVNPDVNKIVIDHLQPWAKAKMEATDGIAEDTGALCLPDGPFRYPINAGQFNWLNAR